MHQEDSKFKDDKPNRRAQQRRAESTALLDREACLRKASKLEPLGEKSNARVHRECGFTLRTVFAAQFMWGACCAAGWSKPLDGCLHERPNPVVQQPDCNRVDDVNQHGGAQGRARAHAAHHERGGRLGRTKRAKRGPDRRGGEHPVQRAGALRRTVDFEADLCPAVCKSAWWLPTSCEPASRGFLSISMSRAAPRACPVALALALALPLAAAFGAARAPASRLAASARRAAPRAAVSPGAAATSVSSPRFLSAELARRVRAEFGTPAYVYDAKLLTEQAQCALAFPSAYGLTVRFAMKACPNRAVLELFRELGVCIDASSGYEVRRAMAAGYAPSQISLSSQEMPDNIGELIRMGVEVNACSLAQLDKLGKAAPGAAVGVRFNPGIGSGGTGKTNVGGPSSSFGIWHEQMPQVKALLAQHGLVACRVHTHIGSGSDPAVWQNVASLTLGLAQQLPDVQTVNLGGGYKVGRMPGETSTDLATVGAPVRAAFEAFAASTGRQLKLEIEPGTFLVANAGALLATVQDLTSTKGSAGPGVGHDFVKLDAGMTEVLRPSLYGAQHPISILPGSPGRAPGAVAGFIVSGHCCESGDLFTCAPGEPEALLERPLHSPQIGDLCVVDGAGAYCAGARPPPASAKRHQLPARPHALAPACSALLASRPPPVAEPTAPRSPSRAGRHGDEELQLVPRGGRGADWRGRHAPPCAAAADARADSRKRAAAAQGRRARAGRGRGGQGGRVGRVGALGLPVCAFERAVARRTVGPALLSALSSCASAAVRAPGPCAVLGWAAHGCTMGAVGNARCVHRR